MLLKDKGYIVFLSSKLKKTVITITMFLLFAFSINNVSFVYANNAQNNIQNDEQNIEQNIYDKVTDQDEHYSQLVEENDENEKIELYAESNLSEESYDNGKIHSYYLNNRGVIGDPVSGLKCSLKSGGCVQSFKKGVNTFAVYYSPLTNTVTHINLGSGIAYHWINAGWENSRLGYPVDIEKNVGNRHWIQNFENGVMSFTDNGVFISYKGNRITDYYLKNYSKIGHAISGEKCGLRDKGCVQKFSVNNNTYAVYSSNTAVNSVELSHPITKYWINTGWENSSIGYPVSDIKNIQGGHEQEFENGVIQYVNSRIVENISFKSKIKRYTDQHKSILGNPINKLRCDLRENGCVQTFRKNNQNIAVYASSVSPISQINLSSNIAKKFMDTGWENGKYGYPTKNERKISNNKYVQEFEKMVVFSIENNIIENPMNNLITKYYIQNSSKLLHPSTNIKCGLDKNGCVQTFISNNNEKIALYAYNNKVSEIKLNTPNTTIWAKQGWENSPLGYPVRQEGKKQYFENGYIESPNIYISNKQAAFKKYYELNRSIYGSNIVRKLRCDLPRGGCVATVQNNAGTQTGIYVTPSNGIIPVGINEAVTKKWSNSGWENGKYGYPIAAIECSPSQCSQRFEKGIIHAENSVYPNVRSRMNGIDIASWQRRLHLKDLKDNVQFVIVKATGGTGYVNPFHKTHAEQTIALGKKIGFYHFAHEIGSQSDAKSEARHFVNTIRPYLKYGPMLVLDNESDNLLDVAWNKEWLDTVYKLTGVKPVIYMSQSTVNQVNWSRVANADYPLWVAYYPYNAPDKFEIHRTPNFTIKWWRKAIMWQYTSNLRLSGYTGNLDGNVFYGDDALWRYYALPR